MEVGDFMGPNPRQTNEGMPRIGEITFHREGKQYLVGKQYQVVSTAFIDT